MSINVNLDWMVEAQKDVSMMLFQCLGGMNADEARKAVFGDSGDGREPLFEDLGNGRMTMNRVMDPNNPEDMEEFDRFMQDKSKTLVL